MSLRKPAYHTLEQESPSDVCQTRDTERERGIRYKLINMNGERERERDIEREQIKKNITT